MPQLSIIVPIYNVENFLDQCLSSIRNQTFKDWECLLFSDGSKDGSIDIMKRFAADDSRFKVIEKKNEGYGTTCNRGLDMAQAEWVTIVEPDDFIDSHMYERLLGRTTSPAGSLDVIKGGYWEYFDGRDGYADALNEPNLCRFMPKRRCEFNLEEFTSPFYHHPSIWSAVYRRGFLNGENKANRTIRFKQVPGAGWTDNPFFAETMVLADRIAWLPGKYYYYRQTNPGASVFLKDFHLPFDRLREMREFLNEQHVSKGIMRAFYSREFDYVTSIIGEFGYDDRNPEVRELIYEVFASMDRKEVFLMDLKPEFRDYYMDFMGDSYKTREHEREDQPDLSIVLLTKNPRPWIVETLEWFTNFKKLSCEFIIADAGSRDSTMVVAREFAKTDKRFVFAGTGMDEQGNVRQSTLAERVGASVKIARGKYIIFVPSRFILGEDMLKAAVMGAKRSTADVALLNAGTDDCDYLAQKMIDRNDVEPEYFVDKADNRHGAIYGRFATRDIPEIAMRSNWEYGFRKLFRTDFLRSQGIEAGDHDIADNLITFSARAMLATANICYLDLKFDWNVQNVQRQRVVSEFWLELQHKPLYNSEPEEDIDSVLALGECLKRRGVYDLYEQGYLNALLGAFMNGLGTRFAPSHIDAYLEQYLETVKEQLDVAKHGALYFADAGAFNQFQKVATGHVDLWLEECMLGEREGNFEQGKAMDELYKSTRFKVGEQVVRATKAISPSWFVARAQAAARLTKRKH